MGNKVAGLDLRRQPKESVEDYKKRVKKPGSAGGPPQGDKPKRLHAIVERDGVQAVACGKKTLKNSTAEREQVTCPKCLKALAES